MSKNLSERPEVISPFVFFFYNFLGIEFLKEKIKSYLLRIVDLRKKTFAPQNIRKNPKVVFGFFVLQCYPLPFGTFFLNEYKFFSIGRLLRLKKYVIPLLMLFDMKKMFWGLVCPFSRNCSYCWHILSI